MFHFEKKTIFSYKDKIYPVSFSAVSLENPDKTETKKYLGTKEYEYFSSLKYRKKRHDYLLSRLSAKFAATNLDISYVSENITITNGCFMQPCLHMKNCESGYSVSITHCSNIGISAVFPDEYVLGIDFENIDAKSSDVIKEYLTENERIISRNGNDMITMMWTAKEALSKIIRTGFTANMKIFEISTTCSSDTENVFISDFLYFSNMTAYSFRFKEYIFSVVMPKNSDFSISDIISLLKKIKE